MSWDVLLYESPSGKRPVEKFFATLQPPTRAKLVRMIDLLSSFGPELGMPNAKPIGGDLYELRIRGTEEVRTVYYFATASTIILLHGFKKKTMAIRNSDLLIAKKRKAELENRYSI